MNLRVDRRRSRLVTGANVGRNIDSFELSETPRASLLPSSIPGFEASVRPTRSMDGKILTPLFMRMISQLLVVWQEPHCIDCRGHFGKVSRVQSSGNKKIFGHDNIPQRSSTLQVLPATDDNIGRVYPIATYVVLQVFW